LIKLELHRGNDRTWNFQIQRNQLPVNLTSALITFTAKRRKKDSAASAAIVKTTGGNGVNITDAPNGMIEVSIGGDDTSTLYAPLYLVWDIEVIEGSGRISNPLEGTLLLRVPVTGPGSDPAVI